MKSISKEFPLHPIFLFAIVLLVFNAATSKDEARAVKSRMVNRLRTEVAVMSPADCTAEAVREAMRSYGGITTMTDLNLQAVTDAIREAAVEKFHYCDMHANFQVSIEHAAEYEYLPTYIAGMDIDGTAFKATLLRYDRGTGRASYGLEIL